MSATRMAKDDAQRLLYQLTMDANRARQIAETNALLEMISGFHAGESGSS